MNISVDLPVELAEQVEQLGIYEFDKCTYDTESRCLTACVSTTFYRVGGLSV